ncbi:ABC transporter permease subunit [Streptomyces sp. NPDC054834]
MSEPPGAAVSLAEAPPADIPSRSFRAQRVQPLRRPGRWIVTAVVLVFVAQILHGLATNPFYQWDRFRYWFLRPTILDGLGVTLEVTAFSAVLGLLGGILLALGRLSGSPVLRAVSWTYTWLFRSVPLIVVLIFLYNFSALYKTLSLGVPFGPAFVTFDESKLATDMTVAVIGLSLNEAAYAAEVVRGGILSVDQGQHEAAAALGLPPSTARTPTSPSEARRGSPRPEAGGGWAVPPVTRSASTPSPPSPTPRTRAPGPTRTRSSAREPPYGSSPSSVFPRDGRSSAAGRASSSSTRRCAPSPPRRRYGWEPPTSPRSSAWSPVPGPVRSSSGPWRWAPVSASGTGDG